MGRGSIAAILLPRRQVSIPADERLICGAGERRGAPGGSTMMTRHLCCRLAGFALTLALLTAGSSGTPRVRPGAPHPIAFVRPAAHDANDGDIWLTAGAVGGERRLTRVEGLSDLAAHRGRLACIRSSDGNLLMLAPP